MRVNIQRQCCSYSGVAEGNARNGQQRKRNRGKFVQGVCHHGDSLRAVLTASRVPWDTNITCEMAHLIKTLFIDRRTSSIRNFFSSIFDKPTPQQGFNITDNNKLIIMVNVSQKSNFIIPRDWKAHCLCTSEAYLYCYWKSKENVCGETINCLNSEN